MFRVSQETGFTIRGWIINWLAWIIEQLEVDGHKDCCSKLPLDTGNLGGRMNDDQISFVIWLHFTHLSSGTMLRAIHPCSNSLTSLCFPNQSGFCPKYPVGNTLFRTTFTVDSRKNTNRYQATRRYGSRTVVSTITNEEGRGRRGKERKGVLPMVGVQEFIGEKFFRMVAGATSAPVGQFIVSPQTFLHSLDPGVT